MKNLTLAIVIFVMSFPYIKGLYTQNQDLMDENKLMFQEKMEMDLKIKRLTIENRKLNKDLQEKIKQLKAKQKPKFKKKVEKTVEDIVGPITEDILKSDTIN